MYYRPLEPKGFILVQSLYRFKSMISQPIFSSDCKTELLEHLEKVRIHSCVPVMPRTRDVSICYWCLGFFMKIKNGTLIHETLTLNIQV